MVNETALIRVYVKDKRSLERRGFYGESIADVLQRELTLSEYWKKQEHSKKINKEIERKLDKKDKEKKKGIQTPNDITKIIEWKMES